MNGTTTNKRVVIDAGHGGADPGAVNGRYLEKDFTLEVAKYIYNRLKQLGIPVYITRDSDETLDRDERVRRILNAFGNDRNVILLSNHINAGGGEGAEVVYALRNTDELANSVLSEIGKQGQKIRKTYQRRYPTDPTKDYYFIHRLTGNIEPLLIEYGFIDNSNDLTKLQNDLLKYGEGVVKAVAEYSNVPYTSPEASSNTYTVKRGDTLYSLSNKFNTSVSELKRLNNLKNDILTIGQVLSIPTTAQDNIQDSTVYVVQKGDSLYSIANKYNVSVDDIISINNLKTTVLQIDQELIIPGTENGQTDVIVDDNTYIVKPGDSLYSIAKNYGLSVDELKSINNLTSNLLVIGSKLVIPSNNSESTNVYTVKKGDTLYSIARQNNTTVQEIKRLNNLDNNLLSVGQNLILST